MVQKLRISRWKSKTGPLTTTVFYAGQYAKESTINLNAKREIKNEYDSSFVGVNRIYWINDKLRTPLPTSQWILNSDDVMPWYECRTIKRWKEQLSTVKTPLHIIVTHKLAYLNSNEPHVLWRAYFVVTIHLICFTGFILF